MSQVLLLQQDARQVPLRDGRVHCIVTSPPYWNLRDYNETGQIGLEKLHDCLGWATGIRCGSCYICVMVTVFQECYRILRNDGVMFVIVGDSYNAHPGQRKVSDAAGRKQQTNTGAVACASRSVASLKPKDLCGIPQRLALALQAAGWYWRSEIIWSKANPMPESVTDRPTKSHEQILMFTKQERYFWDQEAVREPNGSAYSISAISLAGGMAGGPRPSGNNFDKAARHAGDQTPRTRAERAALLNPNGRNLRDVWHLTTEPTSHHHYATFPTELVSRCIRAGSPETCCGSCGTGWQRKVEHGEYNKPVTRGTQGYSSVGNQRDSGGGFPSRPRLSSTLEPSCTCPPDPVPSLVYDPFLGSGTTILVARQLRRHGIGGDLSAAYLGIARERLGLKALAVWEGKNSTPPPPVQVEDLPLFIGGLTE